MKGLSVLDGIQQAATTLADCRMLLVDALVEGNLDEPTATGSVANSE